MASVTKQPRSPTSVDFDYVLVLHNKVYNPITINVFKVKQRCLIYSRWTLERLMLIDVFHWIAIKLAFFKCVVQRQILLNKQIFLIQKFYFTHSPILPSRVTTKEQRQLQNPTKTLNKMKRQTNWNQSSLKKKSLKC